MVGILFICHGNICRSPMAQFVMQHLVDERGLSSCFRIDSAATSTEEIGSQPHPKTRDMLRRNGIPCKSHRSRQMTHADVEANDLVVCMDERNVRNAERVAGPCGGKLVKLLSFAGIDRDVADPWYTGDYETAYDDISTGCAALLDWLVANKL